MSQPIPPTKAVFLDRDGTINVEVNYLSRAEDFTMLAGVPQAIRALREHGYLVIVVTNQSGIERGYYTEEAVNTIHERMRRELAEAGTEVDAIYYCPHAPATACDCRKPAPGLFYQAAEHFHIDLAGSFIVGDKWTDLLTARVIHCRTVMVLTGHGAEEYPNPIDPDFSPDHVSADLPQAVEWILAKDAR